MTPDERARLFVALELPEEVRSALVQWRPSLPDTRLIDAGDLHVTLCFLGWRCEREIPPVWEACARVAGFGVARLALEEAMWLPARRPRVLTVRLGDAGGGLAATQSALSRTLHSGGWYMPETRPFLAHVTVARVAKGARRPAVELPPPPALEFAGTHVTLFRSRLSARGAHYEALGTVELGDPP